jgi:hypothetical protein
MHIRMKIEGANLLKALPPIVRIVITQTMRRRAGSGITQVIFDAQIRRLAHEELEPKGLTLVERGLSGGRTRFFVKDTATGVVGDMMDFASDGMPESATLDVQSHASN